MIKVNLSGVDLHFNSKSKVLMNSEDVVRQMHSNHNCSMKCGKKASLFLETGEIYVCRNCYEVFQMLRKIVRRVSLTKLIKFAIVDALRISNFSQKDAAKKIGLTPRAINYHIRKMGITHPGWAKNKGN